MENSSVQNPYFCLVADGFTTHIDFSTEAVTKASELCLNACNQAVNKIYKKVTYEQPNKDEIKKMYDVFFGQISSSHPFHYANQIGFDATEVQITKGIAYFIDPSLHGEKGLSRLKNFLIALLGNYPENNHLLACLRSPDSYKFQVKAELPINGKRADIFISWRNDEKTYGKINNMYGVMIEAKFGHHVITGQLSPYRKYLHNLIKDKANSALVLLTYAGKKAPPGNKDWQPKSWLSVMTRWEQSLIDEHTVGFAFLRQFIWNKLGN